MNGMIKERVIKVKERVSQSCKRAGRDPAEVTIVAVSKGRSFDEIRQAVEAGLTIIGENRIQEARGKVEQFTLSSQNGPAVHWHMIGHLQTNKAAEAVRMFGLIQSVDSLRCAEAIDKEAAKIGKQQDVLIEIKTSPEATKYGILPVEAKGFVEEISALKNIHIRGLMTIAPIVDNPEQARPYFHKLRDLLDVLNRQTILSMGMTDDFEIAIEEGATMVRLGRAIFGQP